MKLTSDFLMLFLIKVSLCKSRHKYKHNSESLEGDTLIDKILGSNRFNELADKIVDKAIEKINSQQSTVANLASNAPEIETKKSNANQKLEFKAIRDVDKKYVTLEKKTKKTQKRYKPGKINIEAVLKKKILPSDDLSFRYNRFTKRDRTTVSDKPLPKPENAEKASNLNIVNENEESTTNHKIIKKPSANGDSEEQNQSGTDEESSSEENDNLNKTTPNDSSIESTKFTDSGITRITKLQNENNPFGKEKVINWNGRHSDSDDNDGEDKSDDGDKPKENQTSPQVTKEITSKTQTKTTPKLLKAETISTTTSKHNRVNEVDDDDDDQEYTKLEQEERKNKTKQVIRREGDRTYVLKDSSDYIEYHEKLAKIRNETLIL